MKKNVRKRKKKKINRYIPILASGLLIALTVRLSLSKVKSPYCNLDDNWILAGRLVNARTLASNSLI